MNGEVQLIVRTEKLPSIPTLQESLAASIVSGDSFCFGGGGLSASYTVGSKIEIVDQSVSPEVILFTRYVTGYNDATQTFTFYNSWGTYTGINGRFTLPYAYASNPKYAGEYFSL